MTNQELVAALAKRLDWTQKQITEALETTISIVNANLENGKSINIQGFGLFETKKRGERISVHPITKKRSLIPPKIAIAFRPGQSIKENLKKIRIDE